MKILLVDIGTGTQDIFLYDSRLDLENGFKLVLPSPTMMIRKRIKEATHGRKAILLSGRLMGGGPSAWAAADHAKSGLPIYATPEAALTLDDELEKVEALGIKIVSDDEARRLPSSVVHLEMKDFDFDTIAAAFANFGVDLIDLRAVAVAVFDHGAAPPGVSDRQFRFDYLDQRIRAHNSLTSFAYLSTQIPDFLTRFKAVARSADPLDCPLIIMDTAPAAVLGATFDPQVGRLSKKIIANIGNFHTLAFRLGPRGIEGVFEHHTGEIDTARLVTLLRALADSSLTHEDVFSDMGHGALIYNPMPHRFGEGDFDVAITGPRRSLIQSTNTGGFNTHGTSEGLRPYFAVPFGDMMLTGCFGLLAATAELLPDIKDEVEASMIPSPNGSGSRAPWDIT